VVPPHPLQRAHMQVVPDPGEIDLITRIQSGDEAAFRQLYRRHSSAAYAVALRLLGGHRADAEEALQESWLRAVRGLSGFRRS
jgi:RNA polymerase sigma-70 factor (ECF subfamily)